MGGSNMILERNKYELMLTKEMMKQKPEICVVDYDLDDEIGTCVQRIFSTIPTTNQNIQ